MFFRDTLYFIWTVNSQAFSVEALVMHEDFMKAVKGFYKVSVFMLVKLTYKTIPFILIDAKISLKILYLGDIFC